MSVQMTSAFEDHCNRWPSSLAHLCSAVGIFSMGRMKIHCVKACVQVQVYANTHTHTHWEHEFGLLITISGKQNASTNSYYKL